jgi:hypothetical protein
MTDILLKNGDLSLDTRLEPNSVELIAQHVVDRLTTFQTDWILNEQTGLPYLRWAKIKLPRTEEIRALVVREVLAVDGVQRIKKIEIDKLKITLEIETIFGAFRADVLPLGVPDGNANPFIATVIL